MYIPNDWFCIRSPLDVCKYVYLLISHLRKNVNLKKRDGNHSDLAHKKFYVKLSVKCPDLFKHINIALSSVNKYLSIGQNRCISLYLMIESKYLLIGVGCYEKNYRAS